MGVGPAGAVFLPVSCLCHLIYVRSYYQTRTAEGSSTVYMYIHICMVSGKQPAKPKFCFAIYYYVFVITYFVFFYQPN